MSAIQIKGLDKLQIKLDNIEPAIRRGIKASAVHVKGKAAQYPPQRHIPIKSVGGWKSDKQRRYVMGAIRRGEIQIPYQRGNGGGRSENLGKKWTIATENNGMTAKIGNNVSYGHYVQDAKQQSVMMNRIGWQTTEQVAEEERDTVESFIKSEIDKALKK